MTTAYFLGIDIGTQGARVALMDTSGNLIESQSETFPLNDRSLEEQSPQEWWQACLKILRAMQGTISQLPVRAISVTSTSGTVIPVDEKGVPLHNAIMYSDKRSSDVSGLCREKALAYHEGGYTGFNSSSGLSKMVWFIKEYPEKIAQIKKWIHATDYIIGQLCGRWDITDYTNALKSGYDVKNLLWPAYLYEQLPLKKEWLQEVVASGTPIGQLQPALAALLGITSSVEVVAGMTDGCASQVAAGAVAPGDWNTTIGTTLVIKGVTREEMRDPEGLFYSHRHPEGHWMPGGAGNTGADWITTDYEKDLDAMNKAALQLLPTGHLCYPLRHQGERFPFIAPEARGIEQKGLSREELFTANMEGVAYIERYAYQMAAALSGEQIKMIYTAGGGSNSEPWLKIRSNVLNLPIRKMKHITGAAGAAILAASKTNFRSLHEAAVSMTQIDKQVMPDKELSRAYDIHYNRFIKMLADKNYISHS